MTRFKYWYERRIDDGWKAIDIKKPFWFFTGDEWIDLELFAKGFGIVRLIRSDGCVVAIRNEEKRYGS